MHVDEEIARDRPGTSLVSISPDPQLCPVLDDSGRDEQPEPAFGHHGPRPAAARARLGDAGRARLDLQQVRGLEAGDHALAARAAANLALRVRQAQRPAAHAGLAAEGGVVANDPAGPLGGLEAPNVEADMDVLATLGARPEVPKRLVEPLVPTPPIAVAVVEQPGLPLGEHRIRLGELAELVFGIGRFGYVRMPFAGEPMEGPLDRLLVSVPGNAENLVVVPFLDRSH